MERVGEEVFPNDVLGGNPELQGKGCDIPLKLDGHNMQVSPLLCSSVRSDWPQSSSHDYTDTSRMKHEDLSELPQTMPYSMNANGNIVEELTAGNYRNPHQAFLSSTGNVRQSKWQRKYQSAGGSRCKTLHSDYLTEDHRKILSRAGERPIKIDSDFWSSKSLLTEQIYHDTKEISACSRASDKRIISSNTLHNRDPELKTSTILGFSPLMVKKAVKGNGIVHRGREFLADFGGAIVGHIDENMSHARKVAYDALVRSCTKNDQLSLYRFDKHHLESVQHGMSLREWLKPGGRRRDKIEGLQIFRQIVELVDLAHSQGVAFQHLRPSCFNLLPSKRIVFTGSSAKRESGPAIFHDVAKKRALEHDGGAYHNLFAKQKKFSEELKSLNNLSQFNSSHGLRNNATDMIDSSLVAPQDSGNEALLFQNNSSRQSFSATAMQQSSASAVQLEEKWYRSPEQLMEGVSNFSSNIYSLGVLLFELLSWFESSEVQSAAMLHLHDRILPPSFFPENSREAGFCLWLLHPEPSSRPTAREILQFELIGKQQDLHSGNDRSTSPENDDTESALLFHFLNLMKEQKQKHASKLLEEIQYFEEDIKEVEKRHLLRTSTVSSQAKKKYTDGAEEGLQLGTTSDSIDRSILHSSMNEARLMRNIKQIEEAYFSRRSHIQLIPSASRTDKDLLKNPDRWTAIQIENEDSGMNERSFDPLGVFFEGLCKFARYNKFEECGSLKNGDLVSSANVVCSLSLDRDEDHIAAAGVSKKIKIFEFGALLNDSMDVHYPVVEMSNKSKLSCVCWNNYIKNYLASTDYDGVVQIWDAGTGQAFSQYVEHQKRAWSVDFSLTDPMMFVSGSDDCSVKLWSINEKNSLGTIWNPANICCAQFSASSTHMLVFGSADYKIYCYDLRYTRTPWCILAGHKKTVSYVQVLDSETLVSASTDNTIKLWDLNKTSSTGLSSSACSLTFSGHTNEKNFVGLSALDGYIACGSETNEVYCYYRSLPIPITSYKFGCVHPISGNEIGDDSGQFVSSVCWRRKSNMVVAANSSGNMKVLRMV